MAPSGAILSLACKKLRANKTLATNHWTGVHSDSAALRETALLSLDSEFLEHDGFFVVVQADLGLLLRKLGVELQLQR